MQSVEPTQIISVTSITNVTDLPSTDSANPVKPRKNLYQCKTCGCGPWGDHRFAIEHRSFKGNENHEIEVVESDQG